MAHRNIGDVDRFARLMMGCALLALPLVVDDGGIGLIGVVPLATALLGWCPLYWMFGISTVKSDV
jgi:hypothetical protein